LIVESFKESGFEPPKACVKTFTLDLTLGLLATGRYVSIAPRSMLRICAKRLSLKILPIKLQHQASSAAIITLKGRTLSPVAELFIQYAREAAKPLAAAG
jgi:DNA-binding transcriptional LysR family regulator